MGKIISFGTKMASWNWFRSISDVLCFRIWFASSRTVVTSNSSKGWNGGLDLNNAESSPKWETSRWKRWLLGHIWLFPWRQFILGLSTMMVLSSCNITKIVKVLHAVVIVDVCLLTDCCAKCWVHYFSDTFDLCRNSSWRFQWEFPGGNLILCYLFCI